MKQVLGQFLLLSILLLTGQAGFALDMPDSGFFLEETGSYAEILSESDTLAEDEDDCWSEWLAEFAVQGTFLATAIVHPPYRQNPLHNFGAASFIIRAPPR